MSKSELIRKYAVTFPNAKAAEIAVALGKGFTRPYVQQILWQWKNKQEGVKVVKYLKDLTDSDTDRKEHAEHIKTHIKFATAMTSNKNIRELMNTPDPKMPKFTPKHDPVNHPSHYTQGGIETIDFIEAKQLPYNLGNVIKYITRADHKGNKLEDLQKARWYLDREITRVTPPLP